MNFWIWDKAYQQQFAYTDDTNDDRTGKHIWNWFYKDDIHLNGELIDNNPSESDIKEENNQYRVLNHFCIT